MCMKTIIVIGNKSDYFYTDLEAALIFEKTAALDIVIVYGETADDDALQQRFAQVLEKFLPKFKYPESNFRYICFKGKLVDELSAFLTDEKDSSVVLFSYVNGKQKVPGAIDKSTAIKLIKTLKHNFIVAPNGNYPQVLKNILFPVHVLAKVRHKVTFTSFFAREHGANLHILSAMSSNEKSIVNRCTLYSNQVAAHFGAMGIAVHKHTIKGSAIYKIVLNYADDINADLISIIPSDESFNLFSKDYLTEMVYNSARPLLIIAPRKAKISGSFRSSG